MGDFSRDTFDEMRHYVGVRLQQGVPIVDADWNEQEDIRRFELRTFLKWFVGDGVPRGNDDFRILPANGADNDFQINGGDGTPDGAGRCLVDGWEVINEKGLKYTDQPLYKNPGLEKAWGVAPLPPLSTPMADRTDMVYLEVWEREVDATEDPNLINPAIGIETCVRLKREWAVRVDEGVEGDLADWAPPPDILRKEHAYYPLAWLERANGEALIEEINDLRTRLDLGAHLSRNDNPHAVTPDQIGALAAQAYEFSHKAVASVTFTQGDAHGATRAVSIGFSPKFVWAVAALNTGFSPQYISLPCGANAHGCAYIDGETITQRCAGTKITFDYASSGETWRWETGVWHKLCQAVFYYQPGPYGIGGELGVAIQEVSSSGLVLSLSREKPTNCEYGLLQFDIMMDLLLFG